MTIVLGLDRAAAAHLAVALQRHRQALAGRPFPPALVQLQALAEAEAKGGREGTDADAVREMAAAVAYGARDDLQLLYVKQVAAILAVHPRTVRRALDRGDLDYVTVGARRRVPRAALEAYIVARPNRKDLSS